MAIPTPKQQKIIDHFEGNALVISGPGSGKTFSLIEHVKKLITDRKVPKSDIWVMAFNRDISFKLKEKITENLLELCPQITTIHAFILIQTLSQGPQLLEGGEIAESLGNYGLKKLLWNQITYRLKDKYGIKRTPEGKNLTIFYVKNRLWDQIRDYWLTCKKPSNGLFSKFKFELERLQRILKIVFLDELAINFLDTIKANPNFLRAIIKPRIIIDEFQDLNPTEHAILKEFHLEGTTFTVFGDDDQAVNDFRRAHSDYIRDFDIVCKPVKYPLPRDRRCPKEILDLADSFVEDLPERYEKPAGNASHKGRIDILNFPLDDDELKSIVDITNKYINNFPEYEENPQILILSGATGKVKSKSRIDEFIDVLKETGIEEVSGEKKEDPFDSEWGLAFKSLMSILESELTPMNLAGWLTIKDSKLLKTVNEYIDEEEQKGNQIDFLKAVQNLKMSNSNIEKFLDEIDILKQKIKQEEFHPKFVIDAIPKNAEGREIAIEWLDEIWGEFQNSRSSDNDNNKDMNKSKFLDILNSYIDENIKKPDINRIHVTTYRKAKGLEADLVVVTSVDSLEFPKIPQMMRLLYVSATRSKKNLILTYANKRTKARRFKKGKDAKFQGIPYVYRSKLIPSNYKTQEYAESWLNKWEPV